MAVLEKYGNEINTFKDEMIIQAGLQNYFQNKKTSYRGTPT
jgi:hypothetical protein